MLAASGFSMLNLGTFDTSLILTRGYNPQQGQQHLEGFGCTKQFLQHRATRLKLSPGTSNPLEAGSNPAGRAQGYKRFAGDISNDRAAPAKMSGLFTATVLQPDWYELVRTVMGDPAAAENSA
jgi:hypothetical protein